MALTVIPTLDFTDELLEFGDDDEFIDKMTSFQTKMTDWAAAVNANQTDVDAELLYLQNQFPNLLRNGGSFLNYASSLAARNVLYASNPGTLDADLLDQLFQPVNGVIISLITSVGYAYTNSTTRGGTEPAINAIALEFLSAMGLPTTRYFTPFVIGEVDTGPGTAGISYNDGTHTYYRVFSTAPLNTFAASGSYSFSTWFQCPTASAYIQTYADTHHIKVYINGVLNTSGVEVELSANTIHHIAVSYDARPDSVLSFTALTLLMRPNTLMRLACMRVAPGAFQLLPNPGVVPSLVTTMEA